MLVFRPAIGASTGVDFVFDSAFDLVNAAYSEARSIATVFPTKRPR
jgi:hypothetical protein